MLAPHFTGPETSETLRYVKALACAESGDVAASSSHDTAACRHYTEGLQVLLTGIPESAQSADQATSAHLQHIYQNSPGAAHDSVCTHEDQLHGRVATSHWHTVAMRCRLERRLAGCASRDGDHTTAFRLLQQILSTMGCPVAKLLQGTRSALSGDTSSVTAALTSLSLHCNPPPSTRQQQPDSSTASASSKPVSKCNAKRAPALSAGPVLSPTLQEKDATGGAGPKTASAEQHFPCDASHTLHVVPVGFSTRWPLDCAAALHQLAQCLLLQQEAASNQAGPALSVDLAGSVWPQGSLHHHPASESAPYIVGMPRQPQGGELDASSRCVASKLDSQFSSMALEAGTVGDLPAEEEACPAPLGDDAEEQQSGKRGASPCSVSHLMDFLIAWVFAPSVNASSKHSASSLSACTQSV